MEFPYTTYLHSDIACNIWALTEKKNRLQSKKPTDKIADMTGKRPARYPHF